MIRKGVIEALAVQHVMTHKLTVAFGMWTGFDVLLANRMHHQHSSWGGSAASCSEVVAQIKVNELVSYAEMETAWLRCVIKELKSDIL